METITYLQGMIIRNLLAGSLKKAKANLVVLNELRQEQGLEVWTLENLK